MCIVLADKRSSLQNSCSSCRSGFSRGFSFYDLFDWSVLAWTILYRYMNGPVLNWNDC